MDLVFRIFFGMASWLKQVTYICMWVSFCVLLGFFFFFSWFLGTLVQMKRLRPYCYSTHTLKLHTKSLQIWFQFQNIELSVRIFRVPWTVWRVSHWILLWSGAGTNGRRARTLLLRFYLHECLSTRHQQRSVDANPLSGVYVQCWLQLTGARREVKAIFISWKGEGAVLHQLTTNKQDRVPAVWAK